VGHPFIKCSASIDEAIQLKYYWSTWPQVATPSTSAANSRSMSLSYDFDHHHQTLMAAEHVEGWEVELWCYFNDMPADVTPEADVVKYWDMCNPCPILNLTHIGAIDSSQSVPNMSMHGS